MSNELMKPDRLKAQHLNILLIAIIVALVVGIFHREVQHRATIGARDAHDEMVRMRSQFVVDSLSMVNEAILKDAAMYKWRADSIVHSAGMDTYAKGRKLIPTATGQALKDIILWKRQ